MPPRNRARGRGPQQAQPPPPQASDYDTDAPPAVHLSTPAPDPNALLNLRILQRYYPEVMQVLYHTTFATLYHWNDGETGGWEEDDIRGPLFIVALPPSDVAAERYGVIIMSRRCMETFFFELEDEENVVFNEEGGPDEEGLTEDQLTLRRGTIYLLNEENRFAVYIFESKDKASSTGHEVNKTKAAFTVYAHQATESRRAMAEQAAQQADAHNDSAYSDVGHESEAISMGTPLSLSQLFAKQRELDAGFSIHDHHSHPPSHNPSYHTSHNPSTHHTPQMPNQPSFSPHHLPHQMGSMTSPVSGNLLTQLFAKDKQERYHPQG